MRSLLLAIISTTSLFLAACGTDSNVSTEVISDEPGTLIWGGSPATDGKGILLETADTTYGAPGSYEDYDEYFPENENSVEVIADFLITGEETAKGCEVKFPEIRLLEIEVIE
ncbi:hypothetical protein [Rhodohalobacter sp.]|uniref:hypothetical protein n=1 Tax=Rhodohalobacter sp. TaxID=1974210 RepID=UPI002ACDE7FC|nr:hypothetical protein [Rhodohalobacter sp.]MDZ7756949.1 hypothetical protein [Rhodohalobacter sp.]